MKSKITDVKKAVVVGGGYVGVETAENLKYLGIDTTFNWSSF